MYRRLAIGGLLALTLAGALPGAVNASESMLSCVHRDLEIVILIEERGNAQSVPPQILRDATLAMPEARMACTQGHITEALALYDSIARTIASHDMYERARTGSRRFETFGGSRPGAH